jgi:hypothetical protein
MRLSCSPSLRLECRCSYCNWPIASHDPECPVQRIEDLEKIAFEMCCPKCDRHKLSLSTDDYWQCYNCNVVMTSQGTPHRESDETYFIDNWRLSDMQWVRVIPGAKLQPRMHEGLFEEIEQCHDRIIKMDDER